MVKYKTPFFLVIVFILNGIISCDSDEEGSSSIDSEIIESYLIDNELLDSMTIDASGIYYQITEINEGGAAPNTGEVLNIYYRAKALNEQYFDANENDGSNQPKRLQYNSGSVFPIGLDLCFGLLREGEQGVFYIPSALAFGDLTDVSSIIPDQSVIVVELELESIQTEDEIAVEEISLIDEFIIDNQLDDSLYVEIDSVMIPIDSVWQEVTSDTIAITTVFDPVSMMDVTIDSVMIPLDSVWVQLVSGVIPVDTVLFEIDSVELLSSGIYYKRLSEGLENIVVNMGELANIQYSLYNLSSYPDVVIDRTLNNEVFTFEHQQDVVVTGLDDGVSVMEKGESAVIIVPSRLGYRGSAFVTPQTEKQYFIDNDVIPDYVNTVGPYEVLVFEIDLLNP